MKNPFFQAFLEKPFLFLWIGEVCTQTAVNLFSFYLIFVVYQLTNSNTAVSAIVISFTLPAVVFGLLAGIYIDRWNKKQVLLITNLLRALFVVLLALFPSNLFVIYTVSIFFSIITQFFIPAEAPLIPLVVKPKLLFSANALFGIGIFGSILIAYILSGPLLLTLGKVNTALVIAALLAVGAVFVSFIKLRGSTIKVHPGETTTRAFFHEVKFAFSLLYNTKGVFSSLLFLALSQILMFVIAAIAPGYAAQVLNVPVEEFSYLFVVPAGFGVIAGALLIGTIFDNYSRSRLINFGLFLSGISLSILPFASKIASRDFVQTTNVYLPQFLKINNLHILSMLAFLIGIATAFVFIPANTTLQEKTSEQYRGRVYGILNTIVGLGSIFPLIIVGGFSDLIGVDKVITGIGIVLLVLGITSIVKRKL